MAALQPDTRELASDSPLSTNQQAETSSIPAISTNTSNQSDHPQDEADPDSKSGKRRFWPFGKKKDQATSVRSAEIPQITATGDTTSMKPSRPAIASPPTETSIGAASSNYSTPGSPLRKAQSPSPRVPSPASSQIFERNVQEDGLATTAGVAIPTHITTENHIPSVLDAASESITNDHLNPDKVEIVMHAAHQPAATVVTGPGQSEVLGSSWPEENPAHAPESDEPAATSYGSLDTTDVRRLSFISFADVVHAEQADHSHSRDSSIMSGPSSVAQLHVGARSPSPGRGNAMAYAMGGSPLMSGTSSFRGLETSPVRGGRTPGSPRLGNSPPPSDGLTIETMRQALRKTESGDLSGVRNGMSDASKPSSPT
ncbi:hypothetical protein MMC25_005816 [Agyrium rufum]|nr:hypothetical protein [Agyrium rufum]